ncbi:ABC transporter substrate-binding protein [Claveliimonas bilis]|uniref:ABC transporter substrate-binding protein n=1 Tax=Claveliimonas bilis TaxID=3028070 RepID=UPI00292D74ED|nr:ABC transporter substrate-binding protein [Claveliimonas bilis]BDZ81120.1 ABC transporter substrate-binding protein [Claveliimonas bilis]BDZ82936.1 ABC transporter substrate-binding protein [Claveliimonas bilis]
MRKKKLRGVAVVLSCGLTMGMLGGCGIAGEGAAENTKNNEDKTVIEYWHINSETVGGKTVDELVKEFNESNNEIEVVARYNPEEYKGLMQNLQAETAAGNAPAVVQIGWTYLNYFSSNFDYVSPQNIIDEFFPEDSSFITDNFNANILELAQNSDGEQVGMPYSLSTPVLFYNADILKEAGLPEEGPKTWEEVEEFSSKIKESTGKYGLYMREGPDSWNQQALLESNGAQIISEEDGKYKASFASEEGVEAYTMYADMVSDQEALHASWEEGFQAFINGEVAMLHTTIAYMATIEDTAQFDVRAVSSPVWEGKDRVVPAGGCFLAITAQDEEEQKAAWEFEKYLYSVESMAKWTEGTGYVPPRNNVIEAENGLKDFVEKHPMFTAAADQMNGVASWASFPGDAGLEAEQMLIDMRDQILSGTVDIEKEMKETQDSINQIME